MTTELHTLSGAYAIDALSPEEAEAFKTHLEACDACRQEVRELRAAAAQMGASEALVPPAHLRARVLEAADRTPQLPPKVRPIETARSRRRLAALGAAAAAAVIVAAAAIGIVQLGGNDTESTLRAGVVQVFKASDAREASVDTSHGAVRVATSKSKNEMAVDTSGLVPLDNGRVYQVWSVVKGRMVSVAVLAQPKQGAYMPMPKPGTQVAITVEPAGGSKQPTTSPIVQVNPSAI